MKATNEEKGLLRAVHSKNILEVVSVTPLSGGHYRGRMVVYVEASRLPLKRAERAFSTCGIDRDTRSEAVEKLIRDVLDMLRSPDDD